MPQSSEPDDGIRFTIQAIGAASACVAALETISRTLLAGLSWAEIVIPIVSALAILCACLYIVTAKRQVASEVAPDTHRLEPRYGANVRRFAKAGAVGMIALLSLRLWNIRPNFVGSRDAIDGFICTAGSGAPFGDGVVEVLSRSGAVMSTAERLDDRGYFYADLQRWALRPVAVRFRGDGCRDRQTISLESGRRGVCSAARQAIPTESALEWAIVCEK